MDIVICGASIAHFERAASERYLAPMISTGPALAWSEHMDPFTGNYAPAFCKLLSGPRVWHFDELMRRCQGLEMSDPRDRVYALMHLAKDYEDGGIMVDYSKSVVDVALDAAVYFVQSKCELQFLKSTFLELPDDTDDSASDDTNDSASSACQHTRSPICNNTEKIQGDPAHPPTWLPHTWYGDVCKEVSWEIDYPTTMATKCSPHSVLRLHGRLRVRGMKIDIAKSLLIPCLEADDATARQFWGSSLGLYLRVFAGVGTKTLSLEFSDILMGASDHKWANRWLRNGAGGLATVHPEDLPHGTNKHRGAISALCALLRLAQDPRYADLPLRINGRLNEVLVGDFDLTTRAAMHRILNRLSHMGIIMTESKRLCRLPGCDLDEGDEMWIVLGCDVPIFVRPQPNGYYWHICAAEVPAILDDADVLSLSSNAQPGERIGKWVVQDIELE